VPEWHSGFFDGLHDAASGTNAVAVGGVRRGHVKLSVASSRTIIDAARRAKAGPKSGAIWRAVRIPRTVLAS